MWVLFFDWIWVVSLTKQLPLIVVLSTPKPPQRVDRGRVSSSEQWFFTRLDGYLRASKIITEPGEDNLAYVVIQYQFMFVLSGEVTIIQSIKYMSNLPFN